MLKPRSQQVIWRYLKAFLDSAAGLRSCNLKPHRICLKPWTILDHPGPPRNHRQAMNARTAPAKCCKTWVHSQGLAWSRETSAAQLRKRPVTWPVTWPNMPGQGWSIYKSWKQAWAAGLFLGLQNPLIKSTENPMKIPSCEDLTELILRKSLTSGPILWPLQPPRGPWASLSSGSCATRHVAEPASDRWIVRPVASPSAADSAKWYQVRCHKCPCWWYSAVSCFSKNGHWKTVHLLYLADTLL